MTIVQRRFEEISRAIGYEIAQNSNRPSTFYLIPLPEPEGPLADVGGSIPHPLGPYESRELTHGVVIALERLIGVLIKHAAKPDADISDIPMARLQTIAETTGIVAPEGDHFKRFTANDILEIAERLNRLAVSLVIEHRSSTS